MTLRVVLVSGAAFGLLAYLLTRREDAPSVVVSNPCLTPPRMPAIPGGWRRILQATGAQSSAAGALLSSGAPIGTFSDRGSFGLLVEPHCHPHAGWHRGVSVLERIP